MMNETLIDICTVGISKEPKKDIVPSTAEYFKDSTSAAKSVFKIKFYKDLSISRNFDDFSTRIKKFLIDLGFVQYGFVRLNALDAIPRPLIATPHELTVMYNKEKMYEHDMVLKAGLDDNGPFFQSEIEDYVRNVPFLTDEIRANRQTCKLITSFGFVDFFYMPLGAHNGNGRVMLCVATEDKDVPTFKDHIRKCKHVLRDLVEAVDYVGTRKFPDSFLCESESRDIVITPKPLIVLNVLAENDLTLMQTAHKLGISIHTADKHMAAAKKALGANTMHGAIYKAIKVGLINRR
ncbi:MAG: autoinducer binding domain-containing protein [Emcibacter sp.]|nr:autoinducer binding domain-containing protein [Emcibacter sp.]